MDNKKFFWVDCRHGKSWDARKKLITAALESGAKGAVVAPEDLEKAKKLGSIGFISTSNEADIILVGPGGEGDKTVELPKELEESKDLAKLKEWKAQRKKLCAYVEIHGKQYERLAVLEAKYSNFVIVVGKDWKVIPLENLIAELHKEKVEIIAGVKDSGEAKIAFETLEIGADGVVLQTQDVNEIKKISELIGKEKEAVELRAAKITKLKPVGIGDRVCIDTATMLNVGEGMLIGSQANGLFLVHSESIETEYVASRPFRVNAGAVHAYVLAPGKKTKYLSELMAGDEVLAVDKSGNARTVIVGRAKIEKRPLILVEAQLGEKKFTTLLQNAETIMLVDKEGKPVSISRLKAGDEVLVNVKETARHFGMEVEETIIER